MDKEKAVQFVIQELGKHHSREQITIALCEKWGFVWGNAEQLIREVEAAHGREITARQSPLILILGGVIFVTGLGLLINGSLFFINFLKAQSNGFSLDTALQLRTAYLQGGSLLAGIGMIIGALIGCWEQISNLLKE
jgi:hypothetical protein